MNLSFDIFLLEKINGLTGQWEFLDWTGVFFAEYFQYIVVVALLIFALIGKNKEKIKKNRLAVLAALFAAFVARFVFGQILKILVSRPRPFVGGLTNKLIEHESLYRSFPSGHATFFFAIAAALFVFNKKAGYWFLSGAILISLARVFVGVHYPTDILAGAVLGVVVGWLLAKLFKKYSVHGNST